MFDLCAVPGPFRIYNCSNPLNITHDPALTPECLTTVPLASYNSKSTFSTQSGVRRLAAAWLDRRRSVLDTGLIGKIIIKNGIAASWA